MKKIIGLLPYFLIVGFMATLATFPNVVLAAPPEVPMIEGGSTGNMSDITTILQTWITNIRMIGVVVIVFAIIIASIIIGMSLGNAQKRALGISALISAVVGIILVMKAPDLANYFIAQSK